MNNEKKYMPMFGTERIINGRTVYSDIRDEIRAFKFNKERRKE